MKWNFEIIDISEATGSESSESWYRYEIGNRTTRVNGQQRGSREEVTAFVQSCVQRLNTRHLAPNAYYSR